MISFIPEGLNFMVIWTMSFSNFEINEPRIFALLACSVPCYLQMICGWVGRLAKSNLNFLSVQVKQRRVFVISVYAFFNKKKIFKRTEQKRFAKDICKRDVQKKLSWQQRRCVSDHSLCHRLLHFKATDLRFSETKDHLLNLSRIWFAQTSSHLIWRPWASNPG